MYKIIFTSTLMNIFILKKAIAAKLHSALQSNKILLSLSGSFYSNSGSNDNNKN